MSGQPVSTAQTGSTTQTEPAASGCPSVCGVSATAGTSQGARFTSQSFDRDPILWCPPGRRRSDGVLEMRGDTRPLVHGTGRSLPYTPTGNNTNTQLQSSKSERLSTDLSRDDAKVINTQPKALLGNQQQHVEKSANDASCDMLQSSNIPNARDRESQHSSTASFSPQQYAQSESVDTGSMVETDGLKKETGFKPGLACAVCLEKTSLACNSIQNSVVQSDSNTNVGMHRQEGIKTNEDTSSENNRSSLHVASEQMKPGESTHATQNVYPEYEDTPGNHPDCKDTPGSHFLQITLCFAVGCSELDGYIVTDHPQPVNASKWRLLESSGKLEQFKVFRGVSFQTDDANRMVTVTNSRTLPEDEASAWAKECSDIISSLLRRIVTAVFFGSGVSEIEQFAKLAHCKDLLYTINSERSRLDLFTFGSSKMDQTLKEVMPLVKGHIREMLLKIPYNLEQLKMLDCLGFRNYCQQHLADLKLSVSLCDSELILNSQANYLKSVNKAKEYFLDCQKTFTLDFNEVEELLLLHARDTLLNKMRKEGLCCWWRQKRGQVELICADEKTHAKVVAMLKNSIQNFTVVQQSCPGGKEDMSKLAEHSKYAGMFVYRPIANSQRVAVSVLTDVASDLMAEMSASGIRFARAQMGYDDAGGKCFEHGKSAHPKNMLAWETAENFGTDCENEPQPQQSTAPVTEGRQDPNIKAVLSHKESDCRKGSDGEPVILAELELSQSVRELLQVLANHDRFKAIVMDTDCRVSVTSEGFIHVKRGDPKSVLDVVNKLFHEKKIEAEIDDTDVSETIKILVSKHTDKMKCCYKSGTWHICVTADIKDEVYSELEKLNSCQRVVPIPLYALDFIALRQELINRHVKKYVHSSVNINTCAEETPRAVISADRGTMKSAVSWLCTLVSNLERTEKKIEVDRAVFLQGLKEQEFILQVEKEDEGRVDVLLDGGQSVLWATSPGGHQVLVCEGNMATTDCDLLVLPLHDGQREWSPLQRLILKRSLLSEDIDIYHCRGIVSLKCNADFTGKTLVVVKVPAKWDKGENKEKERIISAYKSVFSLCKDGQQSVAVLATQSSVPLRVSAKGILQAVIEAFSGSHQVTTSCKTVVIYTDSPSANHEVCEIVLTGLPQDWNKRPPRVPRPGPRKKTVNVHIGEIQTTLADVVVNSTNIRLTPEDGAVEKAIQKAAGERVTEACRKLYPKGISTNGLAVTDSFDMQTAKKIFHIALSSDVYKDERSSTLLSDLGLVIHHCLLQASFQKHESIAFPMLGSGKLGYPCESVARTMFSTINSFFDEMPHSTLQTVTIVVHSENLKAIQALKMEEITQLYTFSTDDGIPEQKCEMRLNLSEHKVQVIHGNVFQKPWVSEVCVHGELASQRGGHASGQNAASVCKSMIVKPDDKKSLKSCLGKALDSANSIQIAAQTLRIPSTKELACELERLLSARKQPKLVSVIFNNEEDAQNFPHLFNGAQSGHLEISDGTEKSGKIIVCSVKAREIMSKILDIPIPEHYKEMVKLCQSDQSQDDSQSEKDMKGGVCKIVIPNNCLKNARLKKILNDLPVEYQLSGSSTEFQVTYEDLQKTVTAICEGVGSQPLTEQPKEEKKADAEAATEESTTWSKDVDELQVAALKFLLGTEFNDSLDVQQKQGTWSISLRGASSQDLVSKVESLRQEDIQLSASELSLLGDYVDVRAEGIEAFIKIVPDQTKAVVFAFDYSAVTKAKHLVAVKAGRVKVTARSRRRFDAGNPGAKDSLPDQSPPHSLMSVSPQSGPSVKTTDFATRSGIKVSVYKTDITKLPVDAIVNAANEQLAHGGGVAAAIARAAGYSLEAEGEDYIRTHGPLKVSEVAVTTAGSLPCKKVLHAVGPRWCDFTDKSQCQQLLVDTVFNCLSKASSLDFSSVAIPSISSAIFGVPQRICAESYLLAVKRFEDLHGSSTSLRCIHFVDVSDDMVTIIQNTFAAQLSMTDTSGTQQIQRPALRMTDTSGTQPIQRPALSITDTSGTQQIQRPALRMTDTSGTQPIQHPALSMTDKSGTQQIQRPALSMMDTSGTQQIERPALSMTDTSGTQQIQRPVLAGAEPSATSGTSRQEWHSVPHHKPASETMTKPVESNIQGNASPQNEAQGPVCSPSSGPLPGCDPEGLPYLQLTRDQTIPFRIGFTFQNLALIFQSQSVEKTETDAVVLWQDPQNVMKDSISKYYTKKLEGQVQKKVSDMKKSLTTEGKVLCVDTGNKLLVFPVVSTFSSPGKDKIRDLVEQVLNKADLAQKRSIAIPRFQKKTKGKKDANNKDADTFIGGLYTAVKRYAERPKRSITEIHIVETDHDTLKSMMEIANDLVGMDQSVMDPRSSQPAAAASPRNRSSHPKDPCVICTEEPIVPKSLSCGHTFCTECIDKWLKTRAICPTCNKSQGVQYGNQPVGGTMGMIYSHYYVHGFEFTGSYIIMYNFSSGKQTDEHPLPGQWYSHTQRTAYLPDTREGRTVLMLLKVAFDRRLIFTVGQSATTNQVGIIWNDIHHKTNRYGGPECHGYPDPSYLMRVMQELADKGVTEKDLTPTQRDFIQNPHKYRDYVDFSWHFRPEGTAV